MKVKTCYSIILFISVLLLAACGNSNNTNTSSVIEKEFKQYLNTNKSELIKEIGGKYETGTCSIFESHIVLPYIYYKRLGISFLFPNETDDFSPTCITIDEETNTKDINIRGAKPGMKFDDIMKKLGSTRITKTWISTEDYVAYKIEYQFDGIMYTFVSDDKLGTDTEMYVYLN